MALLVNSSPVLQLLGLKRLSSPLPLPSCSAYPKPTKGISVFRPCCASRTTHIGDLAGAVQRCNEIEEEEEAALKMEVMDGVSESETHLYSVSPLPFLILAALPGAGAIRSTFVPFVELVKSFGLPDWLVHWGHPGNMAVVLFAMGGYGSYLGFRIRFSDNVEEKAKAKDLHPKLLAGMFFFFALGATGGVTSLLTSDRPIFESPHAVTGIIGLALLTLQTILPALFEGNPGLRNVHGILGSGIMTLFLVHAALGLQLGLSY
ncbi:hypothetical protein V2J09_010626 [Rumex salicifolius]